MNIPTAVLAAAVGILGALIATVVTQQWLDWRSRRDEGWRQMAQKRERLRPNFERVLAAAMSFQALVAPQSPEWTPASSDEDRTWAVETIAAIQKHMMAVNVALRLEAVPEPLGVLNELASHYRLFRHAIVRGPQLHTDRLSDTAIEEASAITALLPELERSLSGQLEALTPPGTRIGLRSRIPILRARRTEARSNST